MNNIDLFQLTQLAEASYANFPVDPDKQQAALQAKDFSKTQANDLLSQWSIASHQKNTSSGFSATLFQSTVGGSSYVLAIRGTEPTRNQIIPDLGYADVGDIVCDGLAMNQIVDMYNYWQQLKAPQGASYQVAELETLYTETAQYLAAKAGQYIPGANLAAEAYIAYLRSRTDIVIDEPTGMVRKINLNHTSTEIYSDERRFGLGINPASVTVVGHSLGGHLAAAFSRLFPEATTDVLMVNGAGFGDQGALGAGGNGPTNVNHLFSMLGGVSSFNSSKITNLVGSAGMDLTAQDWWIGLNQPGAKEHIQTESAGLGEALGHAASQMTDSMAVYNMFFRLDKNNLASWSLNDAMDYLEPIFKAASANPRETLEALVNAVGKLLVPNYTPAKTGNRDDLYSRIDQIITKMPDSGAFIIPMVGKSVENMIENAKGSGSDGLAFRYALKELNPFVVIGLDYSNSSESLRLLDPVSGIGSLSDAWISDRAKMLSWLNTGNNGDINTLTSTVSPDDWVFSEASGNSPESVKLPSKPVCLALGGE